MEPVDICFKSLQGMTTIISEQGNSLQSLASSLRGLLVMEGPLPPTCLAPRGASGDDRYVLGAKSLRLRHLMWQTLLRTWGPLK
jgi:hypothetical protein